MQTSLRERQRAQAGREDSLFESEPAAACVPVPPLRPCAETSGAANGKRTTLRLHTSSHTLWRGRRLRGSNGAAPAAADREEDGDDEDAPVVEEGAGFEEQDAMRAEFPMSFGAKRQWAPAPAAPRADPRGCLRSCCSTHGRPDACRTPAGPQEPDLVRLDHIHAAAARGAAAAPPQDGAPDAASGFLARPVAGGAGAGGAASAGRDDLGAARAGALPALASAADGEDGEEGAGALVGPLPPPEEGFGAGPGEEDEEVDPWRLPVTHEVAFEGAAT